MRKELFDKLTLRKDHGQMVRIKRLKVKWIENGKQYETDDICDLVMLADNIIRLEVGDWCSSWYHLTIESIVSVKPKGSKKWLK